jgi:hypothetical protein
MIDKGISIINTEPAQAVNPKVTFGNYENALFLRAQKNKHPAIV